MVVHFKLIHRQFRNTNFLFYIHIMKWQLNVLTNSHSCSLQKKCHGTRAAVQTDGRKCGAKTKWCGAENSLSRWVVAQVEDAAWNHIINMHCQNHQTNQSLQFRLYIHSNFSCSLITYMKYIHTDVNISELQNYILKLCY